MIRKTLIGFMAAALLFSPTAGYAASAAHRQDKAKAGIIPGQSMGNAMQAAKAQATWLANQKKLATAVRPFGGPKPAPKPAVRLPVKPVARSAAKPAPPMIAPAAQPVVVQTPVAPAVTEPAAPVVTVQAPPVSYVQPYVYGDEEVEITRTDDGKGVIVGTFIGWTQNVIQVDGSVEVKTGKIIALNKQVFYLDTGSVGAYTVPSENDPYNPCGGGNIGDRGTVRLIDAYLLGLHRVAGLASTPDSQKGEISAAIADLQKVRAIWAAAFPDPVTG